MADTSLWRTHPYGGHILMADTSLWRTHPYGGHILIEKQIFSFSLSEMSVKDPSVDICIFTI